MMKIRDMVVLKGIQVPVLRGAVAVTFIFLAIVCLGCFEAPSTQKFVRFTGYYFCFAAFVSIIYYCISSWYANRQAKLRKRAVMACLGVSLLSMWASLIHYDLGFKIAMDEYVIASTAKSMHESREVFAVSRLTPEGNTYRPSDGFVDKRPWAYPLLVSILHDIIGYRVENAFYLNRALLFALFCTSFVLSYNMFGLWAGVSTVLIWANLPMLGLSASGGGMELLSLFVFTCLVLIIGYYLRRPTPRLEGMMSSTAVFLAYTRYECILLILPVLMVILTGWIQKKRCDFAWGTILASLLLLPLALHLVAYLGDSSAWELTGDAQGAFALKNIVGNFGHALNFFYSPDGSLPNSIVLSSVGMICIAALPFVIRHRFRSLIEHSWQLAALVLFPFAVVLLLIVLGFHASRLDSPFVSRYALMFHWCFVVSIVFLVSHLAEKWASAWKVASAITLICLTAFSLPQMAKSIFVHRNFAVNEQKWLEELSHGTVIEDALVIDRFTIPWTLRNRVSLQPLQALQYADMIANEARLGRYPGIYLIERFAYAGGGDYRSITVGSDHLHELFQLELVAEKSFRPFTLTRVYKVLEYLGQ